MNKGSNNFLNSPYTSQPHTKSRCGIISNCYVNMKDAWVCFEFLSGWSVFVMSFLEV